MTVKEAASIFKKKFPGRVITGYWMINGDHVVFNTRPISFMRGMTEPGQYVVTKNGQVYGTNPFLSNLKNSDMRKYHNREDE